MAGEELKALSGFSKFAMITLCIIMGGDVLSGTLSTALFVIGPATEAVAKDPAHLLLAVGLGLSALLRFVLSITAAVAVIMWMFRCHKNLEFIKAPGLKYKAADTIIYWFIPILSLIKPYMVMKEIFLASDPVEKNPAPDYGKMKDPPLLAVWWVTYLVANLAGLVTTQLKGQYHMIMLVSMISQVIDIISAFCLVKIISDIRNRQEKKIPELKTL